MLQEDDEERTQRTVGNEMKECPACHGDMDLIVKIDTSYWHCGGCGATVDY